MNYLFAVVYPLWLFNDWYSCSYYPVALAMVAWDKSLCDSTLVDESPT